MPKINQNAYEGRSATPTRAGVVKAVAAIAYVGNGTLAAGTVTIPLKAIRTGDRIILQRVGINGSTALGSYTYSISSGVGFTVTAVQAATPASPETGDTSTFVYQILR